MEETRPTGHFDALFLSRFAHHSGLTMYIPPYSQLLPSEPKPSSMEAQSTMTSVSRSGIHGSCDAPAAPARAEPSRLFAKLPRFLQPSLGRRRLSELFTTSWLARRSPPAQVQASPISNLPQEVLTKILGEVPGMPGHETPDCDARTLAQLRPVSRSFAKAVSDAFRLDERSEAGRHSTGETLVTLATSRLSIDEFRQSAKQLCDQSLDIGIDLERLPTMEHRMAILEALVNKTDLRSLDLKASPEIADSVIDVLESVQRHNPNLSSFSLDLSAVDSGNILQRLGVCALSRLSKLSRLTGLALHGNKIGDSAESKEAGLRALASLPLLTYLDIGDNNFGPEVALALSEANGLVHLEASSNRLGPEGASALAKHATILTLNIRNNRLGQRGAEAVSKMHTVEHLDISNNGIGDQGAIAISGMKGVTRLNVNRNEISFWGAKALAKLPVLKDLDISFNRIGAAGLSALAQAAALVRLSVKKNFISPDGAVAFAGHPTVEELDISTNYIGEAGAVAISGMKSLRVLNIGFNEIGPRGAAALAKAPLLAELDVSCNQIEIEGARKLSQMKGLRILNLTYNMFGDSGAILFRHAKSLRVLILSSTASTDRMIRTLRAKLPQTSVIHGSG